MNRRIIYTRPDGGVSIVIPCRNIDESHLTDDEIYQRAFNKLPKDAINPQMITADKIPQDRTHRNAWEHGGDKIKINMSKVKE